MSEFDDEPVDECDACGEDLFVNRPHECPVLGTTVVVMWS